MSTSNLATKLYIPPPRSKIVLRPRLIERLNEGLSASRKLTLISAPAGFGVTAMADLVGKAIGLPGAKQIMEARMTLTSEPAEK